MPIYNYQQEAVIYHEILPTTTLSHISLPLIYLGNYMRSLQGFDQNGDKGSQGLIEHGTAQYLRNGYFVVCVGIYKKYQDTE